MNALNIFPTFVFGDYISGINNELLSEYAYSLRSHVNSAHVSNKGGWQSPSMVETDLQEISNLTKVLTDKLALVYKNLGIRRPPKMSNYWININPPYSYNDRHNHTLSFMSCAYYVKVPKNSGDFVFERNDESKFFLQYFEKETDLSAQSFSITPTESKLILFPSWMYHYVEQNLSNEDRISIAFNFI